MNHYKLAIGGLLALALGVVVYTFWGTGERTAGTSDVVENESAGQVKSANGKPDTGLTEKRSDQSVKRGKKNQPDEKAEVKRSGKPATVVAAVTEKVDPVKAAAAAKAAEEWESLVDALAEMTDAPTKERMASVKESFDKLDKNDQLDAVHRAVNLLPDEQFTSLFGILYDKRENAEVLDVIFSDALNRNEEIKVPMMKDLVVDKEHPMFFESARILDVTGELEKMSGKGDAEMADEQEEEMADDDAAAEQ